MNRTSKKLKFFTVIFQKHQCVHTRIPNSTYSCIPARLPILVRCICGPSTSMAFINAYWYVTAKAKIASLKPMIIPKLEQGCWSPKSDGRIVQLCFRGIVQTVHSRPTELEESWRRWQPTNADGCHRNLTRQIKQQSGEVDPTSVKTASGSTGQTSWFCRKPIGQAILQMWAVTA